MPRSQRVDLRPGTGGKKPSPTRSFPPVLDIAHDLVGRASPSPARPRRVQREPCLSGSGSAPCSKRCEPDRMARTCRHLRCHDLRRECACRLQNDEQPTTLDPDFASPTIGMPRGPRVTSACSAGKITLSARSPVAPKNTKASQGRAHRDRPSPGLTASRCPPNSDRIADRTRSANCDSPRELNRW
jgi:hypothetical protein